MVRSVFGSDNPDERPVNDVTEVEPTLSRDSGPAGVRPSPFLSRSGAVAGEGIDAAVAAHYGDPLREQRLLVEGLAAVDLSHRGVLTITGSPFLAELDHHPAADRACSAYVHGDARSQSQGAHRA
jgi:hypothetical protein